MSSPERAKDGSAENEDDALDLLESLLAAEDAEDENSVVNNSSSSVCTGNIKGDKSKNNSIIHSGDTDSSDDEDNRDFENQIYNECGRSLKKILHSRESESSSFYEKSFLRKEEVTWKKKLEAKPVTKPSPAVKPVVVHKKADVYSDPVFGLRIINPLINSRQLQEKMVGRTAVSISLIQRHIANGGSESDWVIAGVIVEKSPIKTSQKGSQYCTWKLSDLVGDLKTVSVFLFRNSHKTLWKTSVGTVVGILNPGILENSKGSDLASLSIDNAQKVMILGTSKDYGICKARKKNGENCTAFVNTNVCTYCIYHVRQEYKKCSSRSELQSPTLGRGLNALRNKVLGKNEVFYAGQSYTAVPATTSRKQMARDSKTLDSLSQTKLPASFIKTEKGHLTQIERDQELLSSLTGQGSSGNVTSSKVSPLGEPSKILNMRPQLSQGAEIDLSAPVNKFHKNRAKLVALQWIKKNGPLSKSDPNEVRKKEGTKRKLDSPSPEDLRSSRKEKKDDVKKSPKPAFSSKFMELLNAKSKHTDLVNARDSEAQEEYFNVLEKKEKLEEKMLNTFKVDCKAVKCIKRMCGGGSCTCMKSDASVTHYAVDGAEVTKSSASKHMTNTAFLEAEAELTAPTNMANKCRYTAFSASDLCKTQGHPLKVVNAIKRFFRCKDCGNRTVTLDLIPLNTCKNCGGGTWERAPMMRERKTQLHVNPLSIRGDEEIFIGSTQNEGSVNLLIPD